MQPVPILFPYIIRGRTRFIWNDAQVAARDNYYTIDPKCDACLLFALLNNYYIYSQLESCGKLYGKGLLKIQKYDIDDLVIPDPRTMDEDTVQRLICFGKALIRTGDERYIAAITDMLRPFFTAGDIAAHYHRQRTNRLQHEL